jgi:PAT family beta-lactamase induction signal transducer AmpG
MIFWVERDMKTMWHDVLALYGHPRVLLMLPLGLVSGLPLALTFSTLSIWLAEVGVNRSTIGLFALAGLPYALKFLWAPAIDHVTLPGLTRRFGRRRGWMVLTQLALVLSLLVMSRMQPQQDPWLTALGACTVAFWSASLDIVLDAYRVEVLQPHQYGAGAATFILGYRFGMAISGAGALYIAAIWGWMAAYGAMAAVLTAGMVFTWFSTEPQQAAPDPVLAQAQGVPSQLRLRAALRRWMLAPLTDLTRRPRWQAILLFVLLYKLGDAMAGVMTGPFLLDIGFSSIDIANVTKLFGLVATLAGTAAGGWLLHRTGIMPGLMLCGIAQLLSNLLFAVLAWTGAWMPMLVVTIAVENFSGGMGSAALVAYLSGLCHTTYTATQYALLSSLASVGRTVLSSTAGILSAWLGWMSFFLGTALIALPALLLLSWMIRRAGEVRIDAKAVQ